MPFKTYRPSKADQARAVAAQLKADGKPVRPKTVLDILARRGVVMDPGQCSMITGEFRKRRKRALARRRVAARTAPGEQTQPRCNGNGRAVSINSVLLGEAAQFAKNCGGLARAKQVLKELSQIFGSNAGS